MKGPFERRHRIAKPSGTEPRRVRRGIRRLLAGFGIAALAACTTRQSDVPPLQAPVSEISPRPRIADAARSAGPAAPAAPESIKAWTLDSYKLEVARWITRTSAEHLYEGAPPPTLKSVVVLNISVNPEGHLLRVSVLRSNGFKALEQRALQSVTAAVPLPKPGLVVSRRGVAEFTETWLFREDGRFQLRSLALPQDEVEG